MRAVALASGADDGVEGHAQSASQGKAGTVRKRPDQPLGVGSLGRHPLDRGRIWVVGQRLEGAVQAEACPQIHHGGHVSGRGRVQKHGRQGGFGVDGGQAAAEQAKGGQAEAGSSGYWLC